MKQREGERERIIRDRDRQTDRQIDRQTDREMERKTISLKANIKKSIGAVPCSCLEY